MKFLVLGSKGNLGTALMAALTGRPADRAIGWDSSEIDITDFTLLEKKLGDLKPDVIINTVAFNNVDACESSDETYERARTLNVRAVKKLAEAALHIGALLVSYSSGYVFSGDRAEGYDETAEPDPINAYGETKAEGEKELIRFSGRGLRWYLIRTSKLFGPQAMSAAAKPHFFDLMRAQAGAAEVRAVDAEKSSFTYTSDLARATLDLIDSDAASGIYHLVNEGAATWYEAARYLFDLIGATAELTAARPEEFLRPAKRPASSILLNTKRPKLRSWQEALTTYSQNIT